MQVRAEEIGWPQFRGPTGQGHAPQNSTPPVQFDVKKNATWRTKIPGNGWSSPVVLGNQIWVTTSVKKGHSLRAICIDVQTGKRIHNVELFNIKQPERIHADNSYASPTPVVDDKRAYFHFGRYGTAAVDRKSGRVVWKKQGMEVEHQGGPASSPIGYKDFLILSLDGADKQYVVALNKSDGKIAWKRTRSAEFRENPITHRAFSTPLLLKQKNRTTLISIGADQVHAYNPADGSEHWHARFEGFSNVPAPVSDGEMVFIATGFFSPEFLGIKLGGKDEVTGSHVVWKHTEQVPTVPSPIVVGKQVYLITEKGILTCLNCADGKRLWRKRIPGKFSASPVFAGGHLYFCSENGRITVVKPSKEKLNIIATNLVGSRIKASPAIVGSTLYIRTERELIRIDATTINSETP